jgi:transposase
VPSQSKTELYAAIRRDVRGGMSIRAATRKHSVSYPTVTKAMASAWPEPPKKPSARPTRPDVYQTLIDAMLLADLVL